tara:strand:- start:230 stop:598 length:369 start_codon:yes stop_codon:yes gene_type:complete
MPKKLPNKFPKKLPKLEERKEKLEEDSEYNGPKPNYHPLWEPYLEYLYSLPGQYQFRIHQYCAKPVMSFIDWNDFVIHAVNDKKLELHESWYEWCMEDEKALYRPWVDIGSTLANMGAIKKN